MYQEVLCTGDINIGRVNQIKCAVFKIIHSDPL